MIHNPPRFALKFLRWFCREDYIEEIEGDLCEIFVKDVKNNSRAARIKFAWTVLKHFRPSFIKSFTSKKIKPFVMVRHNLSISYRNLKRYKSSFLINLVGLAAGLSCTLLIYLWIQDELATDAFHENKDHLYQVLKNSPQGDKSIMTSEYTPASMARMMEEDFPEVENATSVIRRNKGIVATGEKRVKAQHIFADGNFFKVFSFRLLQGDPSKVFSDKYNVLISESMAKKLYGTTENVMGKSLEWQWWDRFDDAYTVAGVFEDVPSRASLQFDIIFTHALWDEKNKQFDNWVSNNAMTFLLVKNGTDIVSFREKVRNYSRMKHEKLMGKEGLEWEGDVLLPKYADQYLYNKYDSGKQAGGRIQYVKLFAIIAAFILVIACINFMNLATARASRRTKEVGVKKVVGARRSSLVLQYMTESMMVSCSALLLAILLTYLLLPAFRILTGKDLTLVFDPTLVTSMIAVTLLTGFVSGSYPALYLSNFRPVLVLKGLQTTTGGEAWIRKGLVTFQFVIAILLIVSVAVVYQQIEFIQAKNLGYDKDNVITFTNEGKLAKDPTVFINELRKIPGVISVAGMGGDFIGNHGGGGGISWEGANPDIGIEFSGLNIDATLTDMMGIKMASGRGFAEGDNDKVIFNETAIKMMHLKDPVGSTVTMWGEEKQIVGVVKDFNYESLYQNVGPLFLRYSDKPTNTLVRIKKGEEQSTIAHITKAYVDYNGGLPFEYRFMDQDYEVLYAAETRVSMLSRYFAGVAILISCLGLFGLAAFTAERRVKEIGIRKILGCSEFGIFTMLSGDFTKIVLLAVTLALPLGWIIANRWLEGFAYRIDLKIWVFVVAGMLAFIVAWLTVGIQTIKAARVNPAQTLKSE